MNNKVLASIISFALFFALGSSVIFAQPGAITPTPNGPGTETKTPTSNKFELENPFAIGDTLFELLDTAVNEIVIPIGGMIAVLAFIYSGFLYVTAQGKPAALEKANKALLYTAIGTVLLLGSWAISGVIRGTINQFT